MKIAAVFASFNRKHVAMECINRLHCQTRQPDFVVVGENASTDGTVEALEAFGWDRVKVLDTGANLGSAGAIQLAMDYAFELGCDAVWILDDDSWPRADALERLLEGEWDAMVVRHPIQVDPVSNIFTWPLQVVNADGSMVLASSLEEVPGEDRFSTRGVWTGALVPREVREKVGPINGALFIRGEDEEYPWRFEKAGIRQQAVKASVLDHPGPHDIIEWHFMGRRLFIEPGLASWKLYYKIRNMVWLKRQQQGALGAMAMAIAYALGVSRIDGAHRLNVWWQAVADGWRGRLGRRDFTE